MILNFNILLRKENMVYITLEKLYFLLNMGGICNLSDVYMEKIW